MRHCNREIKSATFQRSRAGGTFPTLATWRVNNPNQGFVYEMNDLGGVRVASPGETA